MDISLGPAVCRICMCGEMSIPYNGKAGGEPLISPCRCSGTMGLYHRSCLEHWLTLTRTTQCEICKYSFKISEKTRTFIDYIRMKGYRKSRANPGSRNIFVDLIFLFIVSPLAIFALYLCVKGAAEAGQKYHVAFENRNNDYNGRSMDIRNETSMGIAGPVMTEFALFVFVAIILSMAYFIFILLMTVSHVFQFKSWQKKNTITYVVDQLDAEQSKIYNSHLKSRMSWKSKLAQKWRDIFGASSRPVLEIARSEAIPIDSIVGIAPQLIVNFNQTSGDSDNTHNHDLSRNTMPFTTRAFGQEIGLTGEMPQLYSEKPLEFSPQQISFPDSASPNCDQLGIERRNGLKKTQSVYSVCSFVNVPLSCSTPMANRNFRVVRESSGPCSTFKITIDDCERSHEESDSRGRFTVERVDTPKV